MPTKSHTEDPEDSFRCTCGYVYPRECRGGYVILPGGYGPILDRAARGVRFSQIAAETGLTLHTVRRIVHR